MKNERLKELRKARHLTLRELGEATGLDFSVLSAIENGRRDMNIRIARILADFFHVDLDYILYHTDVDMVVSLRDKLNAVFNEYEPPMVGDEDAHKRLTCMRIILDLSPEMLELALANLKVYSARDDFGGGD